MKKSKMVITIGMIGAILPGLFGLVACGKKSSGNDEVELPDTPTIPESAPNFIPDTLDSVQDKLESVNGPIDMSERIDAMIKDLRNLSKQSIKSNIAKIFDIADTLTNDINASQLSEDEKNLLLDDLQKVSRQTLLKFVEQGAKELVKNDYVYMDGIFSYGPDQENNLHDGYSVALVSDIKTNSSFGKITSSEIQAYYKLEGKNQALISRKLNESGALSEDKVPNASVAPFENRVVETLSAIVENAETFNYDNGECIASVSEDNITTRYTISFNDQGSLKYISESDDKSRCSFTCIAISEEEYDFYAKDINRGYEKFAKQLAAQSSEIEQ